MGYEIKLELAKDKTKSILLPLVLVGKWTYCVKEYSNINSFSIKEIQLSSLMLTLKSPRITKLTDVIDSKIEERSVKKLHRLDEVDGR